MLLVLWMYGTEVSPSELPVLIFAYAALLAFYAAGRACLCCTPKYGERLPQQPWTANRGAPSAIFARSATATALLQQVSAMRPR